MAIPVPKKYVAEFENMGLGLFVHWGLYSQLGRGEWILELGKLDHKEYEKLADTFMPDENYAEDIVLTAKAAGFKYITITARHHDGFSLFDTCGLSEYDSVHTACGRDLMREFVDACRKHDIVPFFYHTTLDWHNPDFNNDFDKYLEYLNKSVEILCKNYGKIGGLWFDGNWSKPDSDWKEDELYATIRKYQPEAMIINNTGLEERGKTGHPEIDSVTYERGRPTPIDREGMEKYLAGEMCETINDHWGIGDNDINYKSPANLVESLCRCRKIGANLLLNIGAMADGRVAPYQKELLKLLGKWVAKFGDAIYTAKPYGAQSAGENFILKGDKKLYIFCFGIGINGDENVTIDIAGCGTYAFDDVTDKVKSVKWMDNDEELKFTQNGDMLAVKLTKQPYGTSLFIRVAEAEIE